MSALLAISKPAHADDDGRRILVDLFDMAGADHAPSLANALLGEFGTLARILAAGAVAQRRVIGNRPEALQCLALVRDAMLHALKTDMAEAPVLSNTEAVLNYLHVAMAHEQYEQVRVLFLAPGLKLIKDEVLWTGSVTTAAMYPREVMRRALELGATCLLIAHNHPSGNLQPSRDDIQITRALVEAGRVMDVNVADHVIISRRGHTSLRAMGYV